MWDQRLPVYVLHWNAPDRLFKSLASLLASEGVAVDLTVVDNGSDPAALASVAESLPEGVRLLPTGENLGYCGAANRAYADLVDRDPDADLLLVAAHDILVRPDCLARLAAAASDHPAYGILGPAHHGRSLEGPVHWIGGRYLGPRGAPFAPPPTHMDHDGLVDVDWVPGMLMCFQTACFRGVGGFDEELFAYWEDVDISLRAARLGWKVAIVPAAAAAEQGYSSAFFAQSYFVARNRVLVVGKLQGWRRYEAAARLGLRSVTALVGSLLPTRDGAHRRRSRAHAAGRWAGVRDGLRRRGGPPPAATGRRRTGR